MGADDAVNYGAIGVVIGHEIGHGFDKAGSQFDGDGVFRNWWTDQDRQEFDKRTANLVSQYNAFKPFEDLALNGEYTLNENIADLGGISIALLAYSLSLNGKSAPEIDGFQVFSGSLWVGRRYGEATHETRLCVKRLRRAFTLQKNTE